MRYAIPTLMVLAACSAPHVGRTPVPPLAVSPVVRAGERTRAAATDEEATKLWLEQEAQRARERNPERPPEPVYQVVERTVYVPGDGHAHHPHDPYHHPHPTFPWNTAVGAGLGAIIGHQSGHRDEGAWIGAGIGFLFDFANWNCW